MKYEVRRIKGPTQDILPPYDNMLNGSIPREEGEGPRSLMAPQLTLAGFA